jgi:predicted aspartyl protease
MTVMFVSDTRKLAVPVFYSTDQRGDLATASGRSPVLMGKLPTLKIGGKTLSDLSVAVVSNGDYQHFGDGLLPVSLFSSIYVNNHQKYVIVNPRRLPQEPPVSIAALQ